MLRGRKCLKVETVSDPLMHLPGAGNTTVTQKILTEWKMHLEEGDFQLWWCRGEESHKSRALEVGSIACGQQCGL